MAIITIFIITAIFVGLVAGLIRALQKIKEKQDAEQIAKAELAAIQQKYKDVEDLQAYKASLQVDLESFRENERLESARLKQQGRQIQSENELLTRQSDDLKRQLALYTDEQTVVDCGLYTPAYDYDISQKYKHALDEVREQQKSALKEKIAAICSQQLTYNGSLAEGKKLTDHIIRLILRAFNGEADSIIGNVRWNNVQKMIDRLEGAYQAINKLGEDHFIKIQRSYFQLKLKELKLTHEYQEKVQAEREEGARVRQAMQEETRAQKEYERAIKESEDEERRSQLALDRARQELALSHGADIAKMTGKIEELERKLAEAQANKERAKSMAEMTKHGNVYIISNIGSFGENMYKIGMTRRLVAEDRIDELSNASVPFVFDIHAMIETDNAPQLEWSLHERFKSRRVNLVNPHKEFFNVSLDEIIAAIRESKPSAEVVKIAEAKEYRQTLALRVASQSNGASSASIITPTAQLPSQSEVQYFVYHEQNQYGPYTAEQIREYIKAGTFNLETSLFYLEGTGWLPLKQLP